MHAEELRGFLASDLCRAQAVLADLDGCLIAGDRVLPDVPALVACCGERLWIVSNNSTDTAASLSARLAAMGLTVPPARILLAGEQTLHRIAAERPGARLALYADRPILALAQGLGLRPDRQRPDLAVLARDTGFGFADLAELMAHLHHGLPLWLSNADASHPGPDGTPRPETGALFAGLGAAFPDLRPQSLAKPAPDLLRLALKRAGVAATQAVFLGDTVATDGAAALAAGVRFVLLARPDAGAAGHAEPQAGGGGMAC